MVMVKFMTMICGMVFILGREKLSENVIIIIKMRFYNLKLGYFLGVKLGIYVALFT